MPALMWFRSDLRTRDNPALRAACDACDDGVIALWLVTPGQWREHDLGGNKIDFLLRNVAALSKELAKINIPLLVREANSFNDVPHVVYRTVREHEIDAVYANREHEWNERQRDDHVAERLGKHDVPFRLFTDQCVFDPGTLLTGQEKFYSVFTPFKKSWYRRWKEDGGLDAYAPSDKPGPRPGLDVEPSEVPASVDGFEPQIDASCWPAGEAHAKRRLESFVESRIESYDEDRDTPSIDGTSSLSPYLASGVVSLRQCIAAAIGANQNKVDAGKTGVVGWVNELIWREFYKHVLIGFPRVSRGRAFKPETERIEWKNDSSALEAWKEGRTGYPIVDAAMRQLRETGWMHNRMRMVTAMFLTKDLFLDWRLGERHFMNLLVDGDLSANNGGWQWSASTGTDAQPYFRVFNPWTQGKKFDPEGEYIRRYCPELGDVEPKFLHDMTGFPSDRRDEIGYPEPVVEHAEARDHAIEAFKALK
ncbi:MAG: deoxyribodipyrimidine photo-lyase [Planctomycetota bacterium]